METTFEKFKDEMRYNTLELTDEMIENIFGSVDYDYKTEVELNESDIYNEGDFSIFIDENLSSLIEDLNGMEPKQIMSSINRQYGNVIDFLYLTEDKMYVMAVGAR